MPRETFHPLSAMAGKPAKGFPATLRRLVFLLALIMLSPSGYAAAHELPVGDQARLALNGGAWVWMQTSQTSRLEARSEWEAPSLLLDLDVSPEAGIFAGIASPVWGPGRSGSLTLSGKVDPMPMVGYRIHTGKSDYSRFAGAMENDERRRLIGHRLEYQAVPGLTLGVDEIAVVSGDVFPIVYFPFPGFPVYALQHIANQTDRAQDRLVNINLSVDASAHLSPDAERTWLRLPVEADVYGQLFIDDAQGHKDNRDWVPDFIGGLVGVYVPELPFAAKCGVGLEYVAITNYVYSHKNTVNNFVYHGTCLGHPLGPDADMLVFDVSYKPDEKTAFTVAASAVRRGEGKIGEPWNPDDKKERIFLSGIVETTFALTAGVTRQVAGPLDACMKVEWATSDNYGHTDGAKWSGWCAEMGLGARL